MPNIHVKTSKDVLGKWKELVNWTDPEASYEDAIEILHRYFDEDVARRRELQKIDSPPSEYR